MVLMDIVLFTLAKLNLIDDLRHVYCHRLYLNL